MRSNRTRFKDSERNYYLDYERSISKKFQERSLDIAKLKLENRELKEKISNYEKALDNAAENI